jgi:hypothetical protein
MFMMDGVWMDWHLPAVVQEVSPRGPYYFGPGIPLPDRSRPKEVMT